MTEKNSGSDIWPKPEKKTWPRSKLKIAWFRKPGLEINGTKKPGLQKCWAGRHGPVPIPAFRSVILDLH